MKKTSIIFLAILFLATAASATQVIILNETIEPIYTLDSVTLAGDLEENLLTLEGTGEVIQGEGVKVYLFGPSSDLLIEDLKVNGVSKTVSFDEKGYFFVADPGKMQLRGVLRIRTIGQVNLYVPGPMNELKFNLQHGYAIDGDRYGLYDEKIILQRAEKVSMLIDGSFRYTYAERNTFYYLINYRAFGSTLGRYTLILPNSETVSSVDGVVKWEQRGSQLILDLKEDRATVVVQGIFSSQNLRVPLKEERHHVLIESDPQKKITIGTSAEEIDLTESTIPPRYANARAFLASYNEVFRVTIKDLGVEPSLAASVSYATNKIAVTSKGSVLSEVVYWYANTGVDYIELDIEGTPLYASTQSGAVKLTKEDKLLLSFPKTRSGTLDVVSFTTRGSLGPIALIDVPVAKSDLPITTAETSVYLPKDYIILETFGAAGGSELPGFDSAILFLIVLGGIAVAVSRNKRFVAYYLVLAAGLYYFNMGLFLLLIAASLALVAKKHLPESFKFKWVLAGAVLVVAIILLLAVPVVLWQLGVFNAGTGAGVRMEADYAMLDESPVPKFSNMVSIGEGEGAISVPQREGVLPVKLELPSLGKTVTVKNHLVTPENPVELKILVVAGYFKYLLYLVSLLAGYAAYREYAKRG